MSHTNRATRFLRKCTEVEFTSSEDDVFDYTSRRINRKPHRRSVSSLNELPIECMRDMTSSISSSLAYQNLLTCSPPALSALCPGRNRHRPPIYTPREEAKVKFQSRQLLVQELPQFFLLGLQGGLQLLEGLFLPCGPNPDPRFSSSEPSTSTVALVTVASFARNAVGGHRGQFCHRAPPEWPKAAAHRPWNTPGNL